jgi:D-alanyl-D-alanine carboxypeptidase
MRPRLSLLAALGLPLVLAACGGGGTRLAGGGRYDDGGRNFTPPGPPGDPWGPYIAEASARFSVPQNWIRVVIRQESGGHAVLHGHPTTSAAGAMGLMQLMPSTYAMLRDRYGLGSDAYDPHDNIIAGTGYLRELYNRYGSPAFLAAYDSGPHRVDQYLAGQADLPNETVNYLASTAPLLGGPAMTGPLAVYAQGGAATARLYAANAVGAGGCDLDAAYNPNHPCRPARGTARVYAAPAPVYVAAPPSAGGCARDPDAAYEPSQPCGAAPAPVQVAEAEPSRGVVAWGQGAPAPASFTPATPAASPVYPQAAHPVPARRSASFALIPSAQAEPLPVTAGGALWGIQVGAFADATLATATAEKARASAPDVLVRARPTLGIATSPSGATLYRARLTGITHPAANTACQELGAKRFPCLTVPPGG